MRFYLGTHHSDWLGKAGVPLFVNHHRLTGRKTFPRALDRWGVDSGGFSELQRRGRWTITPEEYAGWVRRYHTEVGSLDFAAIQDWVCTPIVREGGSVPLMEFAGTGLTVEQHLERTVANLLELRGLAPDLPWAPVLQGWEVEEYTHCADLYAQAGVALTDEPVILVGSLVSRQGTAEAEVIIRTLADRGYRLHGLGIKPDGLGRYSEWLASADSMGWSREARSRGAKLPGCTHQGPCGNCMVYAMGWRDRVLRAIDHHQGRLFTELGR